MNQTTWIMYLFITFGVVAFFSWLAYNYGKRKGRGQR